MSDNPSLLLSEGTCYFGAGQLANKNFIPCGNANINGPQACCYEGDFCLSSNACWDNSTIVTYIAGCTDSSFEASVCPQRINYPDQQWVALARCNGAQEDLWTGCAHHPDEIQIQKENCNCNTSNVLIQNPNGKEALDEIGQLPAATGQQIIFNPTAVPTAMSKSGNGGGLSTGQQAGIGVGVTIAGLLLIAAGVWFFLRRRKSQRHHDTEKSELDSGSGNDHPTARPHYREASVETQKSELSPDAGLQELDSPKDRARELDGTNPVNGHTKSPGY